ncbi:hypothetical protein MP228_008004 [Amoeboaphelidium protococcarum]|nr:hypothetical protein MP228_008004 [Amoeboaphelidium protococcarum]
MVIDCINDLGVRTRVKVKDVYYSPDVGFNLFPVSKLDKYGFETSYKDGKVCVRLDHDVLMSGRKMSNGLYQLNLDVITTDHEQQQSDLICLATHDAMTPEQQLLLLHRRLGHPNFSMLKQMIQDGYFFDVNTSVSSCATTTCEVCIMAKKTRQSFKSDQSFKSTRVLQLLHMDLIGPIQVQTPGNCKYALIVSDDFSGYTWAELLQTKDQVYEVFSQRMYPRMMKECQSRAELFDIKCDRGGEFLNNRFMDWASSQGIRFRAVPAYTPQLNGKAERKNRTVIVKTRALLIDSGLSNNQWGNALRAAVHLVNCSLTKSNNQAGRSKVTPYQIYFGSPPAVHKFKVFGCRVQFYDASKSAPQSKFKFGKSTQEGYFVGYDTEGYWILTDSKSHPVLVPFGEVEFFENQPVKCTNSPDEVPPEQFDVMESVLTNLDVDYTPTQATELPSGVSAQSDYDGNADGGQISVTEPAQVDGSMQSIPNSDDQRPESAHPVEDSSVRKSQDFDSTGAVQDSSHSQDSLELAGESVPNDTSGDVTADSLGVAQTESEDDEWPIPDLARPDIRALLALPEFKCLMVSPTNLANDEAVPKSLQDAMGLLAWPKWRKAFLDEFNSLIKNCTWVVVDQLPPGKTALPCKWLFKVKSKSDGTIDRYKARLVIKGFKQKAGIDYTETFAPVAKFTTIRLVLALAVYYGMYVWQMDFSTAFLNGELEDEIYMQGPEGTELEGKFVRLLRSLYGLKQAPRCWNTTVDKYIRKIGFKRSKADPCLYFKYTDDGKLFLIVLYVDDILLICQDKDAIKQVKKQMMERFDMKDLGKVDYMVGIKVERDDDKKLIKLSQKAYCDKILQRFDMDKAKGVSTPMLQKGGSISSSPLKKELYRSLVGSVMYLMVGTRPDIAYTVSYLSRALENPTELHLSVAKRLLRYLAGTRDMMLVYNGNESLKPVGYADADFAADLDSRRSVTGMLVKSANGAVTWKSKLQTKVAQSTAEAEYYAAFYTCGELEWLKELLNEIGLGSVIDTPSEVKANQQAVDGVNVHPAKNPMIIKEDNQACISLSKNPQIGQKTKHIELKYHKVRQLVEDGVVKLEYCNTNDQLADIFTKPLARDRFVQLRKGLGLFLPDELEE